MKIDATNPVHPANFRILVQFTETMHTSRQHVEGKGVEVVILSGQLVPDGWGLCGLDADHVHQVADDLGFVLAVADHRHLALPDEGGHIVDHLGPVGLGVGEDIELVVDETKGRGSAILDRDDLALGTVTDLVGQRRVRVTVHASSDDVVGLADLLYLVDEVVAVDLSPVEDYEVVRGRLGDGDVTCLADVDTDVDIVSRGDAMTGGGRTLHAGPDLGFREPGVAVVVGLTEDGVVPAAQVVELLVLEKLTDDVRDIKSAVGEDTDSVATRDPSGVSGYPFPS